MCAFEKRVEWPPENCVEDSDEREMMIAPSRVVRSTERSDVLAFMLSLCNLAKGTLQETRTKFFSYVFFCDAQPLRSHACFAVTVFSFQCAGRRMQQVPPSV